MRKVYEKEKNAAGLAAAIAFSIGYTLTICRALLFLQPIARPHRGLALRKVTDVQMDQEIKEKEPEPTVEDDKPPGAPPPPQLADMSQQIPLSANLEVALGGGGALEGLANIGN